MPIAPKTTHAPSKPQFAFMLASAMHGKMFLRSLISVTRDDFESSGLGDHKFWRFVGHEAEFFVQCSDEDREKLWQLVYYRSKFVEHD